MLMTGGDLFAMLWLPSGIHRGIFWQPHVESEAICPLSSGFHSTITCMHHMLSGWACKDSDAGTFCSFALLIFCKIWNYCNLIFTSCVNYVKVTLILGMEKFPVLMEVFFLPHFPLHLVLELKYLTSLLNTNWSLVGCNFAGTEGGEGWNTTRNNVCSTQCLFNYWRVTGWSL
jgi:hypothetical protein